MNGKFELHIIEQNWMCWLHRFFPPATFSHYSLKNDHFHAHLLPEFVINGSSSAISVFYLLPLTTGGPFRYPTLHHHIGIASVFCSPGETPLYTLGCSSMIASEKTVCVLKFIQLEVLSTLEPGNPGCFFV